MIFEQIRNRVLLVGIVSATLASLFGLWWGLVGFVPTDPRWWKWLVASLNHPAGLPRPMVWAAQGCVAGGILVLATAAFLFRQARNRTLKGGFGSDELHGTAHWATEKDVKRSGLLSATGVVVGGWKQGKRHRPLRHNGPEHVMCFAPTRSGKGVSLILPTLLSWQESVLVLDIKGENHALTAGWRARQGHRVLKFDPAARTGCARYNPLAELRIGSGREVADAQNIATIIVDPDGKGLKDHWMKEGWSWLVTSILHVVYRVRIENNRQASLADVRRFLNKVPPLPAATDTGGNDRSLEELFASNFEQLLLDMARFEHKNPVIDDAVRVGIGGMLKKVHTERSGVHSSAVNGLGLWADPIVAANTGTSDWTIADLMQGDKPAALYLVVPPSDIARLRPLLRIMVTQIIGRLTESMAFQDGAPVKGYAHRLLLMLDEFTSLGKIDVLEKSIAYVAGYGLLLYVIVQDIAQLHATYGREEGITGNCHVRVAFAPNRPETAEYLSKLAGKTTVVQARRSASDGKGSRLSDSVQETARPLLTPDEALRLPGIRKTGTTVTPGDVLTFVAGQAPIRGTQCLYFQDAELLERARLPPPDAGTPSQTPIQETPA